MFDRKTALRTRVADSAPVSAAKRHGVPTSRPDQLVRRRLLELLDQGINGPLTLVSAPASTGKTSLVASWAGSNRSPLLWMTLDDADAEAATFWARMSAGLARIGVDVSHTRLLARSDQLEALFPSRLAACLLAHGEPVVLVVDAGRTTSDPSRDRALAELLLRAGGTLRLVLITRADPVFPMEWYRLAGQLTEIRAGDLAASTTETLALLQHAGMTVSSEDAEALCARTNGWMIALKLAIMSLSGAGDVSLAIRRMSETNFDIVTYFFNEVIKALPPETKDILLRTSVVDLLTPGLVELLVGRPLGDAALEFLANGNQLIERLPVGSERRYRYQPLFREFLRAQLAFEKPELYLELRKSAAQYSASGQVSSRTSGAAPVADFRSRPAQPPNPSTGDSVVEPLTPRELEVLEHLAELVPTVEIARAMFISVNTVRTHIRSILRKLDVTRRHQAVRRARVLGLLPSYAQSARISSTV